MSPWGQQEPVPNDGPSMHDLVAQDMMDRKAFGLGKYGTRLQPFNGRDPLKDAYEEVLDIAVYLRQCLYERDLGQTSQPSVAERNAGSTA